MILFPLNIYKLVLKSFLGYFCLSIHPNIADPIQYIEFLGETLFFFHQPKTRLISPKFTPKNKIPHSEI